MRNKYLLLFTMLFCCFFETKATHLMGGELSYTFIGYNATTNLYSYQVTGSIYRYCLADSSTASLDNTMTMGIYVQDPANPNANKNLYLSVSVPLVSAQYITPPNTNPNCTVGTNVCVQKGTYRTTINLPPSNGGYHLIIDRCCRNYNISNINVAVPPGAGISYYAFIPPTAIRNNSPTFATAPVPYLCMGDTVTVLNSAFDADGDSLVYSFEVPYNGISNSNNPNPGAQNSYTWPIPTVNYANATFSVTQPFGTGGYANINSQTGLTRYLVPSQGFYVVAVQVREYRNGVLIGITRRDFQLIVIPCTANNAPALSSTGGSGTTNYAVASGANLCFPINYTDANADSVFVSASGPIFNSSTYNPPATFSNSSGSGSAGSQFCWTVPCLRGNASTYQFIATATDNGCPPKSTNTVYQITVDPVTINSLTGPDSTCAGSTSTYSAASANTTYGWIISGGAQVSGGNSGNIDVNWTSPNGSISVYAINANGCHSDTLTRQIVHTTPVVNAGTDVVICSGETASLGSIAIPDQSYQWSPSTGLSSNTISDPSVSLTTGGTSPQQSTYTITATLLGCIAVDTVEVTVNPNPVITFSQIPALCESAAAINLNNATPSGGTYSGPGVVNGVFTPSSAGVGTHIISYSYTNQYGCQTTDSTTIVVNPVPVVSFATLNPICSNASPLTLSGGSPSNGTYSGTGVTNGIFNPATAGSGPHVITYTVTNSSGCTATSTSTIEVNTAPTVTLSTIAPLCSNSPAFTLTGGAPSGGTYSGPGVYNSLYDPASAGNGSHPLTYTYTDSNSCTSSASISIVVNAAPVVTLSSFNNVCSNIPAFTLTGGSPAGGIYSGSGVVNGVFDPAGSGIGLNTITYYYTNNDGCSDQATASITVYPTPTVTLSTLADICTNSNSITLTNGNPSGGSYSGTGVQNGIFNPATAGIGPHTISYSYTSSDGCTAAASTSITVLAAPVITFGTLNPICNSNAPIALNTATPAGGIYSGPGVSNNTFDPEINGPGTFTINYDYTNSNGCSSQASSSITVNPNPSVSLASFGTACINGGAFTLTGGSPSGGVYSGPGVVNGTFNPSTLGIGTYTITYTYTTVAGCSNQASQPVNIGTPPTVTVTAPPSISCSANTIYIGYGPQFITLTAVTSVPVSSYQWYKNSVLISGATSSTLQVTSGGNYSVVVADANGCSSSPNASGSVILINTMDVRCGQNLQKVVLCHVPPGNPGNPQTLCIAPSAVPAHLANHPGDCLGPCPPLRQALNMDETHSLSIYPNPFTNNVMIEFDVYSDQQVFAGVYDVEGRLVYTIADREFKTDTHFTEEVDLNSLSRGIYFVRFLTTEGVEYQKIIKN